MIDHGFGVYLGAVERKHLEMMRAWRNNPKIWKWCRQNDMISDIDQERWFEAQSRDSSIRMFMIYDQKDQPVGVCGLTSIDWVNRRAEFSLYIGPEKQGNGLGKQGLKTLLAYGFKTMGLHSIWGETFDKNPAAEMFESLGFVKEGARREFYYRDGHFIDCYLYSLLASEWSAGLRPGVPQGAQPSQVLARQRDTFLWNEGREPHPNKWTDPVPEVGSPKKAPRAKRRKSVATGVGA